MLGRLTARFGADRRGSAAVEFALVLPFLVVLLAGITELGKALWDHHALTKSVRDSARYLARAQDPSSATSQLEARNIALRGEYSAAANPTQPYVISYWDNDDTLSIQVNTFVNNGANGNPVFRGPATLRIIRVTATVTAPDSAYPLLSLINGMQGISFRARHEERHIGE